MSTIIGADNNPLHSFVIAPDSGPYRFWWYGFGGTQGLSWNVGFAFVPSIATVTNRIVADNHGMQSADFSSTGIIYTIDVHAEDVLQSGAFANFRIEIGELA